MFKDISSSLAFLIVCKLCFKFDNVGKIIIVSVDENNFGFVNFVKGFIISYNETKF